MEPPCLIMEKHCHKKHQWMPLNGWKIRSVAHRCHQHASCHCSRRSITGTPPEPNKCMQLPIGQKTESILKFLLKIYEGRLTIQHSYTTSVFCSNMEVSMICIKVSKITITELIESYFPLWHRFRTWHTDVCVFLINRNVT